MPSTWAQHSNAGYEGIFVRTHPALSFSAGTIAGFGSLSQSVEGRSQHAGCTAQNLVKICALIQAFLPGCGEAFQAQS